MEFFKSNKYEMENSKERSTNVRLKKGESLIPKKDQALRDVNRTDVTVSYHGLKRKMPHPMVVKKLLTEEEAGRTKQMYDACKKSGLPMMPTYRVDLKRKAALMTDMNLHNRLALSSKNDAAEAPSDVETQYNVEFISEIDNFSNFLELYVSGVKKASENRIKLPLDVYFYIVQNHEPRQKNLTYVIGDLGGIQFAKESELPDLLQVNLEDARWALNAFLTKYVTKGTNRDQYLKLLDSAIESKSL